MAAEDAAGQQTEGAGEPELTELAARWVEAVGARVNACADLLLAESRLAISTFLLMILLTILAGGAILFAWGFFVLALAQLPLAAGLSTALTAFILFALHGVLAFVLWRIANRLVRHMEFEATRSLLARAATDEKTERHSRSGNGVTEHG